MTPYQLTRNSSKLFLAPPHLIWSLHCSVLGEWRDLFPDCSARERFNFWSGAVAEKPAAIPEFSTPSEINVAVALCCLQHASAPTPSPPTVAVLMDWIGIGFVLAGCKYNQVNSHFHCIREGCQFSFLLKHQMTSHARKHMRRMLGKNFDRVPAQVTHWLFKQQLHL